MCGVGQSEGLHEEAWREDLAGRKAAAHRAVSKALGRTELHHSLRAHSGSETLPDSDECSTDGVTTWDCLGTGKGL